jgi:4-amino-4-deoxychorismate lyase
VCAQLRVGVIPREQQPAANVPAVTRVVLLEGLRPVAASEPVLRADDLGVLRGEAVFETLRIAGGRPAHLAAHLQRLALSAARLDIALPAGFPELAVAASEGIGDGVLRLVCSKGAPGAGPVGFAVVTEVPAETRQAREHGVSAVTLTLGLSAAQRAEAPWLLGGVKSTSYAVNMASLRAAAAAGAQDAIWLSSDGWVLEAPTATVVVSLAGELVSPPASVGILAGTTLAVVQELVPVAVRPVSAAELAGADEVLLLSSVRGVAAVVELDGRPLGLGPVGKDLRDRFEATLLR